MFWKPEGEHLTREQARELDDQFLSSRPLDYFRARIAALLAPDAAAVDLNSGVGAAFAEALNTPDVSSVVAVETRDRELQVAVDAFAVRHHAAESLVRLYHALAVARTTSNAPWCLWAAIVDGPTQVRDLVQAAREHLDGQAGRTGFWQLVLPAEVPSAADEGQLTALNRAVNVAAQWTHYAMDLLTRDDLNLNAAHNKVKHGLAVRAQNNELISFTTREPAETGRVRLSELTGEDVIPVIDTTSLAFLSRADRRRGGLELATVPVQVGTVLASAWLIASVHGAMFHLATQQHFAGREGHEMPPFPRLHRGPTPVELLGKDIVGLRSPVTMMKDGGDPRPAALAWFNTHQELRIDHDAAVRNAVIVAEDEGEGSPS